MDHERNEVREQEGTITRIYREDPEACVEAILYALKIWDPERGCLRVPNREPRGAGVTDGRKDELR